MEGKLDPWTIFALLVTDIHACQAIISTSTPITFSLFSSFPAEGHTRHVPPSCCSLFSHRGRGHATDCSRLVHVFTLFSPKSFPLPSGFLLGYGRAASFLSLVPSASGSIRVGNSLCANFN